MKYFFKSLPLVYLFTVISCAPKDEVESKKEQLQELKKQEAALSLEIKKLEKELGALGVEQSGRKLLLIETAVLMPSAFSHSFEVHGTVDSDNNILVNPETAGVIKELKVKEGMKVSKGQVLAVIDTDVVVQSIKEVQTALELAKTMYDKQKRLWEQKVGTELQFLEAKNRKESLESKLATLRSQLAMGTVRAPIDGVVDEVFMKKGEMAAPATPVLRVVNLSSSEIVADVSEAYIEKVKKGDKVEVSIPSIDKVVTGTVISVGQYINPGNRTFKINVSLGSNKTLLRPNMLTRIRINDYNEDDVLVVPSEVIQFDQKGNFVFILDKEQKEPTVKKAYIETGLTGKEGTLVKSGLNKGDVLVISGHRALSDGEKVRLQKK